MMLHNRTSQLERALRTLGPVGAAELEHAYTELDRRAAIQDALFEAEYGNLARLNAEMSAARREGFRSHQSGLADPRPARKRSHKAHEFTEAQLRIAIEVQNRQEAS